MANRVREENKRYIFDVPRHYNFQYIIRFGKAAVLRFFYRILFLIIKEKKHVYQYEVSICAIFKNEAPYLKEWIEYHKLIGVQHFYLYNNNSEDEYMRILEPYIQAGTVTLQEFRENQAQLKAYADCITKQKKNTHWLAFIDIDEFIVPKQWDTLSDFLKGFANRPSVKLNWNVFGTSGLIERDLDSLVIESFFSCWNKVDMVGKCILNNNFQIDIDYKKNKLFHHAMWGKWHEIHLPPVNCFDHLCIDDFEWAGTDEFPIIINHYFTKSYKEYILKSGKGDVFFLNNPHTSDYMWRHERRCMKADYSIRKYVLRLKLNMLGDQNQ